MNAQILFIVCFSASLADVGIALTTCAGLMLIVAMSFTIGDRAVYHGWRGDRGGDRDRQIGNIGGIDVASRRASFAVLPALDAHGTVVPATHAKHKTFIEVIRGYSKPRWKAGRIGITLATQRVRPRVQGWLRRLSVQPNVSFLYRRL